MDPEVLLQAIATKFVNSAKPTVLICSILWIIYGAYGVATGTREKKSLFIGVITCLIIVILTFALVSIIDWIARVFVPGIA